MALDLLQHCSFTGPAFPEPFVRFELEKALAAANLLPKATGPEGQELQASWEIYRRKLRELVARGGPARISNHVLEPLVTRLGYNKLEPAEEVQTREGLEPGGLLLLSSDGNARLRAWAVSLEEDLDAPARRGAAYRFSHTRIAQRVLLASGERIALITNGLELRILLSDPARPDSQIIITIDPHWKRSRNVPDSYCLLLALASPAGVRAIPDLIEKARLQQTRVTKELRRQARQAIEGFVQEVLDHPENRTKLEAFPDRNRLARDLWHESLILIYRLLFILKLETTDDPARSFSFASTSLWRQTYSPSAALATFVRAALDAGAETGHLLEGGLRALFRLFEEGLHCTELHVEPLGGALFGANATPILSGLRWGERAVARLLDRLLWTSRQNGRAARERVHYGPLDVEDLGRVYEALLELEPGISTEPMCRLRRQKLEVVVLLAQGERYRPTDPRTSGEVEEEEEANQDEGGDAEGKGTEEAVEETAPRGKKTKVEWVEEIPAGRFYLRAGLGRKSTGSYYTPHSFVRFLVQETLGPQVEERCPRSDPKPAEILKLKVLDLAMGSGHFLVETCRFLGEKLYEACRLCDERAAVAERKAETARDAKVCEAALREADESRSRISALPDPDGALLRYLPSRAPEGEESGLSQRKAEAICKRMVAVHCLYGVDLNPLAVGLAKLSLWIESHAEGLPLTFLDHRLVLGNSLTGPFFDHLFSYPGSRKPIDDLFARGLRSSLTQALSEALGSIHELEASVGATVAEIKAKQTAKARLEAALAPFKILAAAWAGGIMLGQEGCDDTSYADLAKTIAETGGLPEALPTSSRLRRMIAHGLGLDALPESWSALLALMESGSCIPALPFDLAFPEVFFPKGDPLTRAGFSAVLGNPPWDRLEVPEDEFWANYDLEVLSVDDKHARQPLIRSIVESKPDSWSEWTRLLTGLEGQFRNQGALYQYQVALVDERKTTGRPDLYRLFAERSAILLRNGGSVGCIFPSAFHENEGATGIRRLYLEQMALRCCYSFENRRKLFEIDSRFKFALVVAVRTAQTIEFQCGFYLHDDEWLFGDRKTREVLRYSLDMVRHTGGPLLTIPECRTQLEADLLLALRGGGIVTLGDYLERHSMGIAFGVELHRNPQFNQPLCPARPLDELCREIPTKGSNTIPVLEGKAFNQFLDRGEYAVQACASIDVVLSKTKWNPSLAYYRLAYRAIASSTNERTLICAILTPGVICNHSTGIETTPDKRSTAKALWTCALLNCFFPDWQVRQRAQSNISAFIFRAVKVPNISAGMAFLGHAALRLSCNHHGYAPLWFEQVGHAWREPNAPFTWPVLEGDDARWEVRAAIDAAVADAYDLTRSQYTHILSSFSHKSYPETPDLCLARFDELKAIGLEVFTKKYDPYWDIPLNESPPQPVIDLPIVAESTKGERQERLFVVTPKPSKRGKGRSARTR